jgi:hypothetical protein
MCSGRIFALISLVAQLKISFHSIKALILKIVSTQLVQETNTTPFLAKVNDDTLTCPGDQFLSQTELLAAVTTLRADHVSCKAFGVHPYQNGFLILNFTHRQGKMFLIIIRIAIQAQLELAYFGRDTGTF